MEYLYGRLVSGTIVLRGIEGHLPWSVVVVYRKLLLRSGTECQSSLFKLCCIV